MRQFNLYANQDVDTNQAYPYFVDVQNGMLDSLKSRVVIPIAPLDKPKGPGLTAYPKNLCPVIDIGRKKFILMTHQITSVSIQLMKNEVGSLLQYRDEIIAAIDFLVVGI